MYNITKTNLSKGAVSVYDFDGVKLHAYNTNDPMSDEVFIVEKQNKAIVIEPPCFYDNIKELENYIETLNLTVCGVLPSYHAAGASFLPDVKKYSTKNAEVASSEGGASQLINNFKNAFGDSFDHGVHKVTDYLTNGEWVIGDIKVNIIENDEGFDIVLPEINAVYTHMLGHDCHSIVAGTKHAEAMIAQLEGFIAKGYDLVLTSHYTPEDLKDVRTKIDYLKDLIAIYNSCKQKEEFLKIVKQKYPLYSGDNYLDMTAGFFYND